MQHESSCFSSYCGWYFEITCIPTHLFGHPLGRCREASVYPLLKAWTILKEQTRHHPARPPALRSGRPILLVFAVNVVRMTPTERTSGSCRLGCSASPPCGAAEDACGASLHSVKICLLWRLVEPVDGASSVLVVASVVTVAHGGPTCGLATSVLGVKVACLGRSSLDACISSAMASRRARSSASARMRRSRASSSICTVTRPRRWSDSSALRLARASASCFRRRSRAASRRASRAPDWRSSRVSLGSTRVGHGAGAI